LEIHNGILINFFENVEHSLDYDVKGVTGTIFVGASGETQLFALNSGFNS
jgi:hypothetical protein